MEEVLEGGHRVLQTGSTITIRITPWRTSGLAQCYVLLGNLFLGPRETFA